MADVDDFDDTQKQVLAMIAEDLEGPTSAAALLRMFENVLGCVKPDWEHDSFAGYPSVRSDLDVLSAALTYLKVQHVLKSQ